MKALLKYLPTLIFGCVILVYLNTLGGEFLFDDYGVIINFTPVHSFSGWLANLKTGIRPVLKLTYMLNWISDVGPIGFHLFNIFIHCINSLFIYLLTAKYLERWYDRQTFSQWNNPALFASLLFALHPVQTEAVSYICGRSSSLMAFFYFASMLTYCFGVEEKNLLLLYVASPLLFLLAIGTKETALTLPLVLALWETSRKSAHFGLILKRQAIHWIFLVLALCLVLSHPRYASLLWVSMEVRTLHDNLLSQINGISYLLSRLIWIHRLNIDPDLPALNHWSAMLVGQSAMLAGMLVMAAVNWRKKPWVAFGILFFFIVLFPTNSIMPRLDIANERQMYLASFGIFLPVSVKLSNMNLFSQKWKHAGIVTVLCLLACFTVIRNSAYHNNITLWEDTARKSPNKSRVMNNLAYAYELDGQKTKAIYLYEKAIQLNPINKIAQANQRRLQLKQDAGSENVP